MPSIFDLNRMRYSVGKGRRLDAEALVTETLARTLQANRDSHPSPRSSASAAVGQGVSPDAGGSVAPALQGMLDRLSALRSSAPLCQSTSPGRPQPSIAIPDGASFDERVFRCRSGSLACRLYVPSVDDGRAKPLIVMLHGCTQSPEDFAAGTRMNEIAEEQGFLVAYPRQTQVANAQRCWNWFEPKDQHRDAGEPALIAGLTREIMCQHSIDPARVYVAGLSAGGAAAAIMGQAYPDLYAAVGVHSGLAAGAASDMPSAFAAMRQGGKQISGTLPIPTIVFHGDHDRVVHSANGDDVLAQAGAGTTLVTEVSREQASGGLTYTRTTRSDYNGRPMLELWTLHGAGHAWSGGSLAGSYTEPRGPDASREMMRFFLQHANATIGH